MTQGIRGRGCNSQSKQWVPSPLPFSLRCSSPALCTPAPKEPPLWCVMAEKTQPAPCTPGSMGTADQPWVLRYPGPSPASHVGQGGATGPLALHTRGLGSGPMWTAACPHPQLMCYSLGCVLGFAQRTPSPLPRPQARWQSPWLFFPSVSSAGFPQEVGQSKRRETSL